jgi:hypothetical protein
MAKQLNLPLKFKKQITKKGGPLTVGISTIPSNLIVELIKSHDFITEKITPH